MISTEDETMNIMKEEENATMQVEEEDGNKEADDMLLELFNLIDDDQSGTLEKKEILRALMFNPEVTSKVKEFPALSGFLKPRHFKESFVKLDTKTSGHVTSEEFLFFAKENVIKTTVEGNNKNNEKKNEIEAVEENLKALYAIINVNNENTVPKKAILKALALNVKVMTKIHELDGLDKLLHPHHFDDAFHTMPTEIDGQIKESEFIGFAKSILIENKSDNSNEENETVLVEEQQETETELKEDVLKTEERMKKTTTATEVTTTEEATVTTEETTEKETQPGKKDSEKETTEKITLLKNEHTENVEAKTIIKKIKASTDTPTTTIDEKEREILPEKKKVIVVDEKESIVIEKKEKQSVPENTISNQENVDTRVNINSITNIHNNKKSTNETQKYSNQMYLPALSLSPTKPKRILLPNGKGNKWSYKNGVKTRNMTYDEMRKLNREKVYSPQKMPNANEWGKIDNSYLNRPSEPTPFSASFATREDIRSPVRSPTSLFLQEEQSREGRQARKALKKAIQARYDQLRKVQNVYNNTMKVKANDKSKRKSPRAPSPHHLLKGAHKQYNRKPTRPQRNKTRNGIQAGGRNKNGGRKGMSLIQQYKDIDTRIDIDNDNVDTTKDQLYDEMFDLNLKKKELKNHPHLGPLEKEMKARSNEIQAEMKEMRYKAIIQQAKLKRLFESGSNILPQNSVLDNRIDETIQVYKSEAMKAAKKQKEARMAAEKAHYQWLLTIDDSVQASIDNKLDNRLKKALDDAHSVERQQVLAEKRMLERQRRNILINEYKHRENVLFKSNESRPSKQTIAQEYFCVSFVDFLLL